MKIIAIANQKGGVGKTTTAVTLAHGLARMNEKVVLVDLDTQGNAADALGVAGGSDLYDWLVDGCVLENTEARPGLDLIRSDKTTATLKVRMAGMDQPQRILEKIWDDYEATHDWAILDCAPSVDILNIAALWAADWLLIPTRLDQFAIKGVVEMMNSLAAVKATTKSKCQLAGIVPTFYDRVTNESQEQLVNLAEAFKELVWEPVPQDNMCRIANRMGKTLWEVKRGRAVEAYGNILEKVRRLR